MTRGGWRRLGRFANEPPVSGRSGWSARLHVFYPQLAAGAAMDEGVAAQRLSAFLSDSRMFAEQEAKLCAHSGCAFLCTGASPSHCCRMCAESPGDHGPRCRKKLLQCRNCGFAVTGLAKAHCCRGCAGGGEHGPNCWQLPAADDDESDGAEGASSDEVGSSGSGGEEETEEERAERLALEPIVEANEQALADNEVLIRALRKQLETKLQGHGASRPPPRGRVASRRW